MQLSFRSNFLFIFKCLGCRIANTAVSLNKLNRKRFYFLWPFSSGPLIANGCFPFQNSTSTAEPSSLFSGQLARTRNPHNPLPTGVAQPARAMTYTSPAGQAVWIRCWRIGLRLTLSSGYRVGNAGASDNEIRPCIAPRRRSRRRERHETKPGGVSGEVKELW